MNDTLRAFLANLGARIQSALDRGEQVKLAAEIDLTGGGTMRPHFRLTESRSVALDRPAHPVLPLGDTARE